MNTRPTESTITRTEGKKRDRLQEIALKTNIKVKLFVFFDIRAPVHRKFIPDGQTMNREYYLAVLKRSRERKSVKTGKIKIIRHRIDQGRLWNCIIALRAV